MTIGNEAFAVRQLPHFETLGRRSPRLAGAQPPLTGGALGRPFARRPELFGPAELRLDQLVLPAQQRDLGQHGIGRERQTGGVGGRRQGGSRGQAAEGVTGQTGHGRLRGVRGMFPVLSDRKRPCRRGREGGGREGERVRRHGVQRALEK